VRAAIGGLALALVLAGCYGPSPAVGIPCSPEGLCPSGQRCDMTQTPPLCVSSTGDAAVDVQDAFTGCMDSSDCAAANPICDQTSHACRRCVADLECDGICTEYNGECLSDPRGIFVAETGNDSSTGCTRAQPCKTFPRAFQEIANNKRTIVVLDGTWMNTGSSVINATVAGGRIVISGEDNNPDGAFLTAVTNGVTNPVVINVGSGTDYVIEGLTVRNGTNDGIRNNGDLLLYRMAITNNTNTGVASNASGNAALYIWESSITLNKQEGLNAQKGPVEILRSLIAKNTQYGIFISDSAATIRNTYIVRNGQSSSYGGLRLQNLQGMPPSLSFLTIAYNVASNANIAGISADTTVSITSSILVENNNASTGVDQICSGCTATYSMFSSTTVPIGMGNIAGPADFVDIATDDFHINPTSPAANAADAASTNLIDYDGNVRPSGAGFDMGADELP
jgi:hypothetical protein